MSKEASLKKLAVKPIIISNNKMTVFQSPKMLTQVKLASKPIQQYKDEVIYASSNCDFLKGESQDVLIVNKLNLLNKSSRTVARCNCRGTNIETTSDNVVSVIGQKNYETVLSALSSVFNEETKVRGIMALLTVPKKFNTAASQSNIETIEVKKQSVDRSCQTEDSRLNMFVKEKQRKRIRRQALTPYVVTEEHSKVKKLVINVNEFKKDAKPQRKKEIEQTEAKYLPELKGVLVEDDNSNISCGSIGSLPSVPGILEHTNEFLSQIDKVTDKTLNSTAIRLRDGSEIMIPVKPEDVFHIATPEILKNVTREERMKLIWHQAFIDFKMCLEQDEDGYYPLHVAVLHRDTDLVRRLCTSMRARHESVDIPAGGLTALQMAVRENGPIACTNILLQNGADPLLCDQERRCSLHMAAEADTPQLRTVLTYCDNHARSVLKNNQDFWRPELESKSDIELTRYLYGRVGEMFDEHGYTPLMLAAEAALPSHVALLAARAGPVDRAAPDCGATALYRVVARACLHAKETGNTTTTPEKYLKTIEVLVQHGADPGIENHSGSSVNTLLTEFNISSMSMVIANTMTAVKHGYFFANNKLDTILFKHSDGRISYEHINNVTEKSNTDNAIKHEKTDDAPSNVHAIITVGINKKGVSYEDINNANKTNTSNEIVSLKAKKEAESKEYLVKDCKVDNTVVRNVLDGNKISYTKVDGNQSDSSAKTITVDLNTKPVKNEIQDIKMQRVTLGNVILKAKANRKVKLENSTAIVTNKKVETIPLKVNFKDIKHGNLSNVTFKRLSNGQMITIKSDGHPVADTNMHFVKINKMFDKLNAQASEVARQNKEIAESIKKLTKKETIRSAKQRKRDNVVIVENVAVKPGSPIAKVKPGTSKSVKPRDVVISPVHKKSNDSPKYVIAKKDPDTLRKYRKRKLVSE